MNKTKREFGELFRVLYVVGPYRAGSIREIVENIRRAEKVALKYWKAGFAVVCPHMNSALFDGALPDEEILEGCLNIMGRCDGLVVLPTWESSPGSRAEIARAQELGLKIIWEKEDQEEAAA